MKSFTRELTVNQWIAIKDNPAQRDTMLHAKRARKKHLKYPSPTHAFVSAAQLPNNQLIKLDGHTRSYLWKEKELAPPADKVICAIFPVASLKEAASLYQQFDNQNAVETTSDKATGALRLNNIKPNSKLLQVGRFASAIEIAEACRLGKKSFVKKEGRDIYELCKEFKPELLLIDEINPIPNHHKVYIVAAMLITLRKHGESVMCFWEDLREGLGTKEEKGANGVFMVEQLVMTAQLKKQFGSANNYMNTAKTVSAVESYLKGYLYKSGLKRTNLTKYLKREEEVVA